MQVGWFVYLLGLVMGPTLQALRIPPLCNVQQEHSRLSYCLCWLRTFWFCPLIGVSRLRLFPSVLGGLT